MKKFYALVLAVLLLLPVGSLADTRLIPKSGGGAGGAGSLTLIETKVLSSAQTTVTFSGLDGNTDGIYYFDFKIKQAAAAAATVVWRPNGATTNLRSDSWNMGNFTTPDQTVLQLHKITDTIAQNLYLHVFGFINAKKNAGGQTQVLSYTAEYLIIDATTPGEGGGKVAGFWNETSTNLTSIDVVISQTNGFAVGSTFSLYKYAT
jgi:hypothetical protein